MGVGAVSWSISDGAGGRAPIGQRHPVAALCLDAFSGNFLCDRVCPGRSLRHGRTGNGNEILIKKRSPGAGGCAGNRAFRDTESGFSVRIPGGNADIPDRNLSADSLSAD